MAEVVKPVILPIDSCVPVDWNPNVEDLTTFNDLVTSIETDGFLEPILVAPAGEDTFDIVGGEHRWKAAKLAGLKEISAVVKDWTLDEVQIRNVRMNVIRGKFDPEKFASLWKTMEKKYGRSALLRLTGMAHKERELERLLGSLKTQMPKSMQDELDKHADKIRNVEDLAVIVQSLYAKHGGTLDSSYMFLTFGGKMHLMIKLTKEMKEKLEFTLTMLRSEKKNANELIAQALDKVME